MGKKEGQQENGGFPTARMYVWVSYLQRSSHKLKEVISSVLQITLLHESNCFLLKWTLEKIPPQLVTVCCLNAPK